MVLNPYHLYFAGYPTHVHDDYNVDCVCDPCYDPDYPDYNYPDYDCTDEILEKPEGIVYHGAVSNFRLMGILCEKGMSSFA